MTAIRPVLFEQEMTRKKFLSYIGLALLTIFGLNNLISLMQGKTIPGQTVTTQSNNNAQGFGSRKFGD